MISDTLASYGSLARYTDVKRIAPLGANKMIGASGEFSDFQFIQKFMAEILTDDVNEDDGSLLNAREIHSLLARILYNNRSKMTPLYNQLCIGGFAEEGKSFLGLVDLYGTAYTEDFLATGFGSYMAIPILRNKWRPDMEEKDARELLCECMRVLFYRDCRTINRLNIGKMTREGCVIEPPFSLTTEWSHRRFVDPHNATI